MESYREKLKLQNVVFAIGCVALALFSVLGFLGEAGVVKLAPSVGDGHWQSRWRGFISGASIVILAMLLFGLILFVSSDLGSALIFFSIFLVMLFAAGFALHWFAIGFAAIAAMIVSGPHAQPSRVPGVKVLENVPICTVTSGPS